MASSPKNYDKYTYALRRKSEKEPSPPSARQSSSATLLSVDPQTGLAPLTMNRDGFAVSEDGSLMSRLVSPPLHTGPAAVEKQQNGSPPMGGRKSSQGVAANPNPRHNVFNKPPAPVDGWQLLVQASEGDISEEDLALLQWDTVQGLLHHYNVKNPVDVARAQLVWKQRQNSILENGSMGCPSEFGEVVLDASVRSLQGQQPRLQTQPISTISYGRPSSPRAGASPKFVPGHQKPLSWKKSQVASRVDCGPIKRALGGSSFASTSNGSFNNTANNSSFQQQQQQ